ncbi:MAG: class II aldolase/adducin family protein, partial [Candidatus Eisenbacteria bacterium]
ADVGAIVHAHPPTATGFAVAGVPLADCVLPEILSTVGSIPLAPYGTPGGEDLAGRILPIARTHDAFLLKNHGAMTLGKEIWQAFHRMEMIESFARTLFTARQLGRVEPLDPLEVTKLLGMRPAPPLGAEGCGGCRTCKEAEAAGAPPEEDQLVEEVIRRLAARLGEAPDRIGGAS